MRILIHSVAPHVPSGYGVQCGLLIKQLNLLGHQVAVSSVYGISGAPMTWENTPIFPQGRVEYGLDTIVGHARLFHADLIISVMDARKLLPIAGMLADEKYGIACWLPIDTEDKLGAPDKMVLDALHAFPLAMSKHGLKLLNQAGFPTARYVPHAIDADVYHVSDDREKIREDAGLSKNFVIGINSANNDMSRKSWPEQVAAFSKFAKKHKDALLLVHTHMNTTRGHNLYELFADYELSDQVKFTDQYIVTAGLMESDSMAEWYSTLNVLSNCAYGEGFGVPILEAQSVGTPVVVTKASAMKELCGAGWTVTGEPFWNPTHHAEWIRPSQHGILAAYEKAYQSKDARREDAAAFAIPYDYRAVATSHWKAILDEIEEEL
jgi:glycosyltransferase involved in cell wall biosynthesis